MRQNSFYDIYPVTSLLLLLVVGFFALEVAGTKRFANPDQGILAPGAMAQVVLALGSNHVESVRDGEYWRLLVSIFLHGGVIHLFFNGMVLFDLGRLCEPRLSGPKFFTAFILSGLGGSLASYGWHLYRGELWAQSVGSSGALAGLIGLLLVYSIKERQHETRNSLLRSIVLIVLITLLIPHVDHAAHLGGFVVGGLIGLTVGEHTTSHTAARWRIPSYVAGLALAASLATAVYRYGVKNWNWHW